MRNFIVYIPICLAVILSCPDRSYAQWVQTEGPEGGTIFDLAVSGGHTFAAVSGYRIYRSKDSAGSWESVSPPLGERIVITQLAALDGDVFAIHEVGAFDARDEERFGNILPGVLVTSDAGKSWQDAKNRMPKKETVRFLKACGDTLFANTCEGRLYTFSKKRAIWQPVDSGNQFDVQSLAANDHCIVLASRQSYKLEGSDIMVYVTEDQGNSWRNANSGLPSNSDVVCLATDGSCLFASLDGWVYGENKWDPDRGAMVFTRYAEGRKKGLGIFKSSDNGASWMESSTGLPANAYVTCLVTKGSQLFAGVYGWGVYRSSDGGATWTPSGSGVPKEARIHCLAEDGKSLYAGTIDHGLFVSGDEGKSWTAVNTGLVHSNVRALAVQGPNLLAGTGLGNMISTDGGRSYQVADKALPNVPIRYFAEYGQDLLAGTSNGVYLVKKGGLGWTDISQGLPEVRDIDCLAACEKAIYAGITFGIFFTPAAGTSWTKMDLPVRQSSQGFNRYIRTLLPVGAKIFVGTPGGILWSTNQGTCWTSVGKSFPAGVRVHSLATRGSDIFAGTRSHGVFRSSDEGVSWSKVSGGLPEEIDAEILLVQGTDLIAVTDKGIFHLGKSRSRWRSIGAGLPREAVVLCLAANDEWLFAGTDNKGIWKFPLSSLAQESIRQDDRTP